MTLRQKMTSIDQYPAVAANAIEAINRSGLEVIKRPIRGGTDGSRLSFIGLPCPNIFAAEQAIHSKLEWTTIQDLHKVVETIVHLSVIWYEKALE